MGEPALYVAVDNALTMNEVQGPKQLLHDAFDGLWGESMSLIDETG
jgi:hypothetical protein